MTSWVTHFVQVDTAHSPHQRRPTLNAAPQQLQPSREATTIPLAFPARDAPATYQQRPEHRHRIPRVLKGQHDGALPGRHDQEHTPGRAPTFSGVPMRPVPKVHHIRVFVREPSEEPVYLRGRHTSHWTSPGLRQIGRPHSTVTHSGSLSNHGLVNSPSRRVFRSTHRRPQTPPQKITPSSTPVYNIPPPTIEHSMMRQPLSGLGTVGRVRGPGRACRGRDRPD